MNLNSFLNSVGLQSDSIELTETSGMYPHKAKHEENWSYFTAFGFKYLKEKFKAENKRVDTVAIVGIGSGVEGILAAKIFAPDLKHVVISDIDCEVVDGAFLNIKNSLSSEIEITSLIGSYTEPIETTGILPDLIYGNIPNLPSMNQDLSQGAEKGTFVPETVYLGYNPPEKFVGWALASQYSYLKSAQKVLSENGSVVTALGGRMPYSLMEELFAECGLKFEEILVCFKEQTEALIDFEGYHKLEKAHGVTFEFYRYEESLNLLKEKGIENPTNRFTGREINDLLEQYKVSAGEALELYNQNIAVGHTVHILRGLK